MKKAFIVFVLFCNILDSFSQSGSVGIGTETPSANAILDIISTDKGILIPRIALNATNIASPITAHEEGMLVYNTAIAGTAPYNVTPGFYYNNGTQWVKIVKEECTNNNYSVIDNTLTSPPSTPTDNDKYLIPIGATGIWSGQAKKIATYDAVSATWSYLTPSECDMVYIQSGSNAGTTYKYESTNWITYSTASIIDNYWKLNGNVTTSTRNKLGTVNNIPLNIIAEGYTVLKLGNNRSMMSSNSYATNGSFAFGSHDTATTGSFAMGSFTKSTGWNSMSVGAYNHSAGSGSIALGGSNKSFGNYSIALGGGNITTNTYDVAIGNYDSVVGGGNGAYAFGYGNKVYGNVSLGIGQNNRVNGESAHAYGVGNHVNTIQGTAFGRSNYISGNNGMAFGHSDSVLGINSVAYGWDNTISSNSSHALGESNIINNSGYRKYIIGFSNISSGGNGGVIIGNDDTATSTSSNAYIFGNGNKSSTQSNFILGMGNHGNIYQQTILGMAAASPTTSSASWIVTDPLLTVGGSNNLSARINVLNVLKNGKTLINANSTTGYIAPRTSLDILGTDGVIVPVGTTGQRPSSAAFGTVRYNSTIGRGEMYVNDVNGDGAQGDAGWRPI